ncbi:unnamed protein product [Dibothriocephalus latus]|uniref:Uncharacterized protein n=1 Tax=Dibothriocephalus latus TaxID=60516 RepID=A0A3P6REG6_DIBLA|nr:unnamed protein product [Dibothriocephalus latus]
MSFLCSTLTFSIYCCCSCHPRPPPRPHHNHPLLGPALRPSSSYFSFFARPLCSCSSLCYTFASSIYCCSCRFHLPFLRPPQPPALPTPRPLPTLLRSRPILPPLLLLCRLHLILLHILLLLLLPLLLLFPLPRPLLSLISFFNISLPLWLLRLLLLFM